MFNISNNGIITMTRGDTASFPIFINVGNIWLPLRYKLGDFDYLYFSVMEHGQSFEEGVIRKIIDSSSLDENGDVLITLKHSDTVNLLPGNYTYEVKLATMPRDDQRQVLEPEIRTISPKKKFILFD